MSKSTGFPLLFFTLPKGEKTGNTARSFPEGAKTESKRKLLIQHFMMLRLSKSSSCILVTEGFLV
jgi:hypothetical protein